MQLQLQMQRLRVNVEHTWEKYQFGRVTIAIIPKIFKYFNLRFIVYQSYENLFNFKSLVTFLVFLICLKSIIGFLFLEI